jgi:uncharacterized phage protein (TIGR01671 family)
MEVTPEDDAWEQFWALVDKSTLGQFTGLKDRNGQDICEGDIVRCYDGVTDSHFNSAVVWLATEIQTVPLSVAGFVIGSLGDVEVIGNIHEHHELLEGKSE